MSNFSFLRIENEYTRNEAYKKMVEYALTAESYFYVMDTACAQYTRYAIEQYVEFVSALYNIEYTNKPKQLAHYLYGDNSRKLISKIGESTFVTLRTVNDLSKAYLHVGIPRSDKKYNEILLRLHDLMVDLYKRIGGKRTDNVEKFSYEKIETITEIIAPDGRKLKVVSAEEIISKMPNKEPDSPKPMYEVRKQQGSIFLIDKDGNVLNRFVDYEKYQGTEGEKKELKEKIKELENTYASIVEKMFAEIDGCETKISELQRTLKVLEQGKLQDSGKVAALKQQISRLEEDKRRIRTQADEQIVQLQEKWLDADNKYHSLYASSAEEQKKLKAEIIKLLTSRNKIRKDLLQTEAEYNTTISKLKIELEKANSLINNYQSTYSDNSRIISQLKKKIEQLEKEKSGYITNFEKRYAEVQVEIKRLLKSKEHQQQQNVEWQKLVSQLIFENDYYKEVYIRRTKQEEKEYLFVVQNAISQMNEKTSLYQQSITEQMLRAYLLRVKKAYEDIIENERKHADYWKHKYESEHMMPKVREEDPDEVERESVSQQIPEISPKKKKRIFSIQFAAVSVICFFVVFIIYLKKDRETGNHNQSADIENSFVADTEVIVPPEKKSPIEEDTSSEEFAETEERIFVEEDTSSEEFVETEERISVEEDTSSEEFAETEERISVEEDTSEEFAETEEQESTEVPTSTEAELNNQLPDGSVIQNALNRKKPPKTWLELEGINEELLKEIASVDESVLHYYILNEEKYNSMGYQDLGECGIFNTSYGSSVGEWYQRGIFQEDLYKNTNHSHIQFFYYRSSSDGAMGFAVLPESLSSEINAKTTIEELTELFVAEPSYMVELEDITDFSTAEKEIGVVYKVTYSQDALFLFNEDGIMCDYVYISARPYDYDILK